MFAGAAREAVFSNPDVIRKVNAEFVPVALKAGLVNNPPDDDEGRLYREIARSKPAPQGICVVNSAGKVLAWSLMFDNDKSVLAFFDYTLKRFRDFPDAALPLPAERFMHYPSEKLQDSADTRAALPTVDQHANGQHCCARIRFPQGTIVARVIGRALGADGKPVADTVRQEHYLEDRFEIPLSTQESLARQAAQAGANRFKLPDELALAFVSHAFLGQLDVNPLGSPAGGSTEVKRWEFWAQRLGNGNGLQLRVEGSSEVAGGQDQSRPGAGSDGRMWEHAVKLTWGGFIDLNADRITRVLLTARGTEKLKWGNAFFNSVSDVQRLPGGHPIDLACGVQYGIIGEPVAGDEVGANRALSSPDLQAGARAQQLVGMLGPQFLVFLPAVQDELKVSEPQKRALEEMSAGATRGWQQFNLELENSPPNERGQKLQHFREEANRMVANVLAQLLQPQQQMRLRQIMLQQQGLLALGNPELANELKLTDDQRTKFDAIVRATQRLFENLQQRAQSSGNPEEIHREAMKIKSDQQSKVETLLTDAQRKQWKDMLGKPLKLD